MSQAVSRSVTAGSGQRAEESAASELGPSPTRSRQPFRQAKADAVARFEHEYLVTLLQEHGGNITASAHAAGVDRVHFVRILDRHGLRRKIRAT